MLGLRERPILAVTGGKRTATDRAANNVRQGSANECNR